ncbi:hypothetical protein BpHYR1_033291 [Brachionus plicatilis]|uniref:Uncharacterized protein n=1 Tax=Brachionus plicatilis TaxID=10195 RepID=A0A3M7R888_BRAPC|nr:hypothetical protein BpHYR1_033291 [Brachionus plicatilis]
MISFIKVFMLLNKDDIVCSTSSNVNSKKAKKTFRLTGLLVFKVYDFWQIEIKIFNINLRSIILIRHNMSSNKK